MFARRQVRVRWLLVGWVFLLSAISYLDRVNISIAAPEIAKEFRLDNIQLGWVFSAFVIGYAIFQAPAGHLADRKGARTAITLGVLWWGFLTASITFLSPATAALIPLLLTLRFCLGAGEAVIYPASNRFVASWIPVSERGVANGLIFAGVGFGAGVTSPLITYLMLHHGWRSSFWASAALGFIAGGVWYAIYRDTPAQHPWVSPQEAAIIEAGLPQDSSDEYKRAKTPWRKILHDRDVAAITFSYFCYGYAAYIFFSWFFIYLNSAHKLNLKDSSYYAMLPFLVMAITSPLGGWISDRLTKRWGNRTGRCAVAGVAMGIAAVFIALGSQVNSAGLASVVLAGGVGALYLSQSSFWSVSADIGKRSAGSVSGLMNMGGQIGGAATASLTPIIAKHFGWGWPFLVAACLCAAGSLAWIPVQRERRLGESN